MVASILLPYSRGSLTRYTLDFRAVQNMNRWMIPWCHPAVWEPQGSPWRSAQNLHDSSAHCANTAERRIQHLESVTMTVGPPNHKSPCAKSPCFRTCCQTDFESISSSTLFTYDMFTWSLLIVNHNAAEIHPSFWFRLLLSRPPALPVDFQQVSPAVWGEATLACQHWKGTHSNLNLQWKPAEIPAESSHESEWLPFSADIGVCIFAIFVSRCLVTGVVCYMRIEPTFTMGHHCMVW